MSRVQIGALIACVLICSGALFAADHVAVPSVDQGFRQMYNLDFSGAHQTFESYQREDPADPLGHVANAAAYLFAEFDRLHILESDLFTDDQRFESRSKASPDPAVKTLFEAELTKADELSQRALQQNPKDQNALFSQVLANGLRCDYLALIEKRNLASLAYMKAGRIEAEKLLAIDPSCYDAYLAIGVENYLLGINPAPVRWMLQLTGSHTDKAEGLQRLRLTAEKGRYLAPFARLLLAVAALRDKDKETARTLLAGLATEFPHNQLYSKELARIQ